MYLPMGGIAEAFAIVLGNKKRDERWGGTSSLEAKVYK
jgi:hypothetical protein